jgi:hypothetical protein
MSQSPPLDVEEDACVVTSAAVEDIFTSVRREEGLLCAEKAFDKAANDRRSASKDALIIMVSKAT